MPPERTSTTYVSKPGKKGKTNGSPPRDGLGMKSPSDHSFPFRSPPHKSKHHPTIHNDPRSPYEDFDEEDDTSYHGNRSVQHDDDYFQQHNNRGHMPYRPHRRPDLDVNALAQLNLYEHCSRLRKQGIAVRFGPRTAEIMAQGTVASQLLRLNNTFGNVNYSADILSTQQENQLNEQSILILLALGAEIDIPPLIKCNECSEQFLSQADKDEHTNRGQNKCLRCPMVLPCKTAREEHIRLRHPPQAQQTLEYPNMKGEFSAMNGGRPMNGNNAEYPGWSGEQTHM